MSSLSRRDILKLLTVGSTALSLPLHHFTTADSSIDETLNELISVHRAWLKTEASNAESHLSSLLHTGNLKQIISEEFSQGDVIYVNGLILSRTEAAIGSYYVEHFSNNLHKI